MDMAEDGKTEGWKDLQRQTYIPPPLAADNNTQVLMKIIFIYLPNV